MVQSISISPDDFHSYHCSCSQLLFTSTTPIDKLTRRQGLGLDKAYILHLPALPDQDDSENEEEAQDSQIKPNGGDEDAQSLKDGQPSHQSSTSDVQTPIHFAFSLTYSDGVSQVVVRSDGFEKRYWARCQRCNIIVGYHLDWTQYQAASLSRGATELAGEQGEVATGPHTRILYLIPGNLSLTEDMLNGKNSEEEAWQVVNGTVVASQQ